MKRVIDMKRILFIFLSLTALPLSTFAADFVENGIKYKVVSGNDVEVVANGYSGDVTIPGTVTHDDEQYNVVRIGSSAFKAAGVTSVTIDEGVTEIRPNAFEAAPSLEKVVLPQSMKVIGNQAFKQCMKLLEINIDDPIESIGTEAFMWCFALSINFVEPASLKSLGVKAFYLHNLHSITLNANIKDLPAECFAWNSNADITEIVIPEGIETIGELAFASQKITSLKLPSTLKKIGKASFQSLINLEELELPGSLTEVGEQSFTACGMRCIVANEGVESLALNAFQGCNRLENVSLPNSLKAIGERAFFACGYSQNDASGNTTYYGLRKIVIPEGVETIGENAFASNPGLDSVVVLPIVPPTAPDNAFDPSTYEKAQLVIHKTVFDDYANAECWKNFSYVCSQEELTGVEVLNANARCHFKGIFDLQGRCVNTPRNNIYIVDGKKVLVK